MSRTAALQALATLVALASSNPVSTALRQYEAAAAQARRAAAALPRDTSPERRQEIEEQGLTAARSALGTAATDTRSRMETASRAVRDWTDTRDPDDRDVARIERDRDRWRRMESLLDAETESPDSLIRESWDDPEALAVLVRELPARMRTAPARIAGGPARVHGSRSVAEALARAETTDRPGGWTVERAERRLSTLLAGEPGERLRARFDRADAVEIIEADVARGQAAERDHGGATSALAGLAGAYSSQNARQRAEGRRQEAGQPVLLAATPAA